MTDDTGVWLYAVTRTRAGWDGLTGVAETAVRPIERDGLVALGSTVDLATFGEAALKRNLEDLDWLAATARSHDEVVRAAARRGVTVPLRLTTLYRDDDRVRAMLAARGADIRSTLRHLDGRAEWGVKGYADRAAEPVPSPASASSGTDYLNRRRAQLSSRRTAEDRVSREAVRVHETLAARAVAARRHALQGPLLTGESGQMLLNSAYLVDDRSAAEFRRLVTELSEQPGAIRLQLTGPWPPYSFSHPDLAATP
jgi:hypothetical protein